MYIFVAVCMFFSLCRAKLKQAKLKKYLKEICERQKKSLLRNQDLLKEFDDIEACVRKFASCSESLQKLKVFFSVSINTVNNGIGTTLRLWTINNLKRFQVLFDQYKSVT